MAARVIVWAVRLGTTDLEGQKGHLQLDTDRLSFVPEKAGNDITIPLSDVRRVRRPPGSPVLVIERTDSAVAFYFVEPPPLRFRSETSRKAKGRMKSIRVTAPWSVSKSVSRIRVPSRYRRRTDVTPPAGAICQRPCWGVPSRAAKQAPESNRGRQSQSIDPSRATRADVRQSPIRA